MKKFLILLFSCLLFFIAGCGEKKIEEPSKNIYTVATDPDYYPFQYIDKDSGVISGFEIDLINEVAKRANIKIELVSSSFTSILPEIANKKYDIGVSTFSITDSRKKIVNFIEYMPSEAVIIGNSTLTITNNKTPLYAATFSSSHVELLKALKGVTPIEISSNDVLFDTLLKKEVDYVVADRKNAEDFIKKYPELYIKEVLNTDYIGIAVSKDLGETFYNNLSKIVFDMKSDGTLDKLKNKYNL